MAEMKWRKRLAVVKIESTYGTPSADMTGATILEVVMLDGGNPYAGNTVERERMRDGFGSFEQINTGPNVTRTIRVPYAGSGTAGTPPAYGPLLRACAMSETIDTATVGEEKVIYQPVSENIESVEIWWFEDGQVQQINGARGTWSLTSDSESLPYIEFQFTGLYSKPEAMASVGGTQAVQAPEIPINKLNTAFSVHSFNARMQSLSLDIGNTVEYRNLINYEGVHITDRRVAGSINIEAPALSEKDFFAAVESHSGNTLAPLTMTHGVTAGNIVEISGQRVQLANISPSDSQGIIHYSMDTRFLPSSANDDDFTLTFK